MTIYTFIIQTPRALNDENSPHLLAKFDFVAENFDDAQKYQKSLFEHYRINKPKNNFLPAYEYSELKTKQ